jgi:hypothetical protein
MPAWLQKCYFSICPRFELCPLRGIALEIALHPASGEPGQSLRFRNFRKANSYAILEQ